ncbi:MAG: replicative DNA helicase [Patescibacteria group bacterium]|nr:replicative DNA helicase [Patescibacteria group bacterium]
MPETEKLPPQNVEAEKSLLGCLMIDPDAIWKVADFLTFRDFYKDHHQKIYGAMQGLFEKREPIDLLSLTSELKEKNQLQEIGGGSYLAELVNAVPTASHILNYAKIVQEKRILRDLISASQDINHLAYKEAEDVDSLLDEAEKRIFGIAQRSLTQKFVHVKDTLEETWRRIEELHKQKGGMRGLPTGFRELDNTLAGLQKSDLIILAARPSMGKCISKDTEIVMSNPGSVCSIEEVVKQKKQNILSLGKDFKIAPSQASAFIDNGIQPVYKVKTASGREVETTITHPFLTIDGWKPLSEIRVGEKVGVPRVIPVFGEKIWPDYEIKTLAYFIAEGGLTESCPAFTNGNIKIQKDFLSAIAKFPNVKVRTDKKRGQNKCLTYVVSSTKERDSQGIKELGQKIKLILQEKGITQKSLSNQTKICLAGISAFLNGHNLPLKENFLTIINSFQINNAARQNLLQQYEKLAPKNSINAWLQSFGLMGKLAIDKFIPSAVFELNKKSLALFLNRLFSCDGSFWQSKKQKYYRLSYSSGSYRLIKQVQHLLLRFGVLSKTREKRTKINGKKITAYELEVMNAPSLLKFIREIGMYREEAKIVKAEKYLTKTKQGWAQDTIPIKIWEKISEIKGQKSWRSVYKELHLPDSYNIHAFRRSPRRETVLKLAYVLNSTELIDIAQSDIYWDKIAAIAPIGEKQVYDLTVSENHNFIANDFIIHNSSLALDIARNVAVKYKIPVGVFSLEMSKDQIIDRLIASQADVDLWRLRTGRLSDQGMGNDFERIQRAMAELSESPLYIDDISSSNILQMRAMARRLAADKGLGLLIIDYLQLMESRSQNPNYGMVQQVSENSRALKSLAKELCIPVLVLSQLSRAVEQRVPQIPRLADLRESGSIEQDADVVMFIYREDRYKQSSEKPNVADILIAKHRNGPIGKAELFFDETRATFRNLDKAGY